MRNTFKIFFVAISIGLLVFRPSLSYADWHGHGGGGHYGGGHSHGHSYIGVNLSVWPDSYYYGAPYYPYYQEDDVLVSPPVIVQQPVTVTEPSPVVTPVIPADEEADSITINIPNDKGGYTAVTLKKSGNGYIGPQGEFYSEFPKVSQLRIMYGK